jgi:hypothetical protein
MPLDNASAPDAAEPEHLSGQDNLTRAGEPTSLMLASAVMFVAEVDRSAAFYAELLAWTVTVQDADVALLVSPDGYQLYLRRRGPRAIRSLGEIGLQYLIWTAPDENELRRCELLLRAQPHTVTRTTLDGFTAIEGRDPDDVPILVTYPGPRQAPRHQVMKRIYGW